MPTADELYQESACFICRGLSQVEGLKLAMMARWLLALDPTADVTPAGLEAYGACFGCNSNASLFDIYELSLLDQIANAA
jgi:hypothetical protein